MTRSPRHALPRRPRVDGDRRRRRVAFTALGAVTALAVTATIALFVLAGSGVPRAESRRTADGHAQAADLRTHESYSPSSGHAARSRSRNGSACTRDSSLPSWLLSASHRPRVVDSDSRQPSELGVKVQPARSGSITGMAFWKGSGNTGRHVGTIWSGGRRLATATFANESAAGWQRLRFRQPVQVRSGQPIVVAYSAPNGHFSYTPGYFGHGDVCHRALRAIEGLHWVTAQHKRPTFSASANDNYYVDVHFVPDATDGAVGGSTQAAGTDRAAGASTTAPGRTTPADSSGSSDPTRAARTASTPPDRAASAAPATVTPSGTSAYTGGSAPQSPAATNRTTPAPSGTAPPSRTAASTPTGAGTPTSAGTPALSGPGSTATAGGTPTPSDPGTVSPSEGTPSASRTPSPSNTATATPSAPGTTSDSVTPTPSTTCPATATPTTPATPRTPPACTPPGTGCHPPTCTPSSGQ